MGAYYMVDGKNAISWIKIILEFIEEEQMLLPSGN